LDAAPPREAAAAAPPDGLPTPRRYLSVAAILLSIGVTVLDSAMLNVALPGIARDLNITPATATWLLNAYQLSVVSTLLPFAALAEIVGFRRVFIPGMVVFALASAGAAFAPSFEALLACRIAQGLGASAVMSLTAALIRYTYPAAQLGRAIGINAMAVASFGAAAPSIGAAVLAVAAWPALFLVQVPVAFLGLALGIAALPDPPGQPRRFDLGAAGLNVAAFTLVFLGLDLMLAMPVIAVLLLAGGITAFAVLVARQWGVAAPLLPVDLLRDRVIATSVAASVCGFAAWYVSFVALPFHLSNAGRSATEIGLLMTPWPLGMAVAAPLAGRLADRLPTATLCALGMGLMAVALALLALLPGLALSTWLVVVVACCGAGFGAFQTPNNRTMLSAAPRARSGGAGGMQATARLLGTTLGTTVCALCFQLAGPRLALFAGVAFAVASGALSLTRRR